jgi:hypothetical protein
MPGAHPLRPLGRALGATLALTGALALAPAAHGQALAPKRALTLPAAPQCAGAAAPATARDPGAARAEAARARELALNGESRGARDAFARAAALDPADPALAYDLARAAEEASDRPTATAALCRYLVLAPDGREAGEVRSRLARLAGGTAAPRDAAARAAFQRGVDALESRRYEAAVAAFDDVLRQVPSAPEAVYDRGLARLALEQDAAAAADLAAYVASPSAGPDRAQVLRAVEALRAPSWSPGGALGRGLLVPGLGQLYTGRPVVGLLVLAGAATGVGAAFVERTRQETVEFRDAFGNPYSGTVTRISRPYATTGLAAAGAVAIAGAAEAAYYAMTHRRERPRLQLRAAAWRPPDAADPARLGVSVGATLAF